MYKGVNKIFVLKFLNKSFFLKKNVYIKIEDRNLFVQKNWIGFKLAVYNGKFYIPIQIKENMVGKMLGSLIFSRKIIIKTKKKFRK